MKIISSKNKNIKLKIILKEYYNEIMKYCPLPVNISNEIWYKTLKKLKKIDNKIVTFTFTEDGEYCTLYCRNNMFEYRYGLSLNL